MDTPDASFSTYYQDLCEVTCMFLKLLILHASTFKYDILVKLTRHYLQMKLAVQKKKEQDKKECRDKLHRYKPHIDIYKTSEADT